MDSSRLAYLFHRYVNNTCTEAEKSEFMDAVTDVRQDAETKALMDSLWREVSPQAISSERSRQIIKNILQEHSLSPVAKQRYLPWGRIAASLLLMVLFSAGFYWFSATDNQPAPLEVLTSSHTPSSDFVELPDGSTVILNARSKLENVIFTDAVREVSLTGEAYFDIAHDAARPFVVHTGKLSTTVLGTAFNIKAYPDQSDITVTVRRGKVKVSDERKVLGIINPDQQITFDRMRDYAEQKGVDTQSVTAWMEKDIFFDDVTIGQALGQLEKRFGVSIRLANENIAGCKFTATFAKGEDLGQILRILCDFNNALLTEDGGSFVIEGGKCPL